MAKLGLPTEAAEQKIVVSWLRAKGYMPIQVANDLIGIVPNHMRSRIAAEATRRGMQAGAPDLIIVEPAPFTGQHTAIEMKRSKGGKLSEAQLHAHSAMNANGWCVVVGRGANDAIAKLEALGY